MIASRSGIASRYVIDSRPLTLKPTVNTSPWGSSKLCPPALLDRHPAHLTHGGQQRANAYGNQCKPRLTHGEHGRSNAYIKQCAPPQCGPPCAGMVVVGAGGSILLADHGWRAQPSWWGHAFVMRWCVALLCDKSPCTRSAPPPRPSCSVRWQMKCLRLVG